MRLTAVFFFTLLVVFSVSALDTSNTNATNSANSTDTSNSSNSTIPSTAAAQSCSNCWVGKRNQMDACKSIPSSELAGLKNLTDAALGTDSSKYPNVVACLCALSANVKTIISQCPCDGALGDALTTEAAYVGTHVCPNTNANTGTNVNQSGDSTTDPNSAATTTTTTGASDDPSVNAAQANSAVSIVPWTKSIISLAVALVAAGLYVF